MASRVMRSWRRSVKRPPTGPRVRYSMPSPVPARFVLTSDPHAARMPEALPAGEFLVPYEELEGSPTYSLQPKSISAKRSLKVYWGYVDALVEEFTPRPGNIFATFPGRPLLWVDTIEIQPFPGCLPHQDVEPAFYDWAQVDVNYKTVEWDAGNGGPDNSPRQGDDPKADDETLISHKVEIGGEFMMIPAAGLRWFYGYNREADQYGTGEGFSKHVLDDVGAGVLIPLMEHEITWHKVRFPPWQSIKDTMGCVNDRRFSACPIGTLLFAGCEANIDFSAMDTKYWTLTYKMSYKNLLKLPGNNPSEFRGWNHFFRPESGKFEFLTRRSKLALGPGAVRGAKGKALFDVGEDWSYIYALADFRPLFQAAV